MIHHGKKLVIQNYFRHPQGQVGRMESKEEGEGFDRERW